MRPWKAGSDRASSRDWLVVWNARFAPPTTSRARTAAQKVGATAMPARPTPKARAAASRVRVSRLRRDRLPSSTPVTTAPAAEVADMMP